jgi:predicted phosphodiesterase
VLARRLLTYLDAIAPGARARVSTIYFGHTHAAFQGFRYEGILFYNTGCALRGLTFAPYEFETT